MTPEENLASLRAALASSPGNVALRRHVAEVLLGLGRAAEAEAELLDALRRAPSDADVKLALARAYRAQEKTSAALVVLEDMVKTDAAPGRARIELARTLIAAGDVARAVREYRAALDEDPDVADAELAARLGIDAAGPEAAVVDGRQRVAREGEPEPGRFQPTRPDIDFSHVGGMDALKEEIRKKIIHPLRHPELYQAYGKKIGGGILLYGPPGCGKTHLARATAGEVDATFLSIGIHEVLDMWVGQSERNLHSIFEVARASTPCVLFFDEVDALGASRAALGASAGRQTINQFLAELDGLSSNNDGLLVLAATNAPWHMDAAFRRPGRFDRLVFVPPPDAEARSAILRILLDGKPQDDIELGAIAKRTDGFSGADLAATVETAIEGVLDEALSQGRPVPLSTKDLLRAAKRRKATTAEWFGTARNYVLYANQGGIYDDLRDFLKL